MRRHRCDIALGAHSRPLGACQPHKLTAPPRHGYGHAALRRLASHSTQAIDNTGLRPNGRCPEGLRPQIAPCDVAHLDRGLPRPEARALPGALLDFPWAAPTRASCKTTIGPRRTRPRSDVRSASVRRPNSRSSWPEMSNRRESPARCCDRATSHLRSTAGP